MYQFGNTSASRLSTCYDDLQLILNEAIKVSDVDFGVSQGERTVEQQQQYFDEGKSKINPKKYASKKDLAKKAKHITLPGSKTYGKARAVDIYAYIPGKKELAYNTTYLAYIGGVITGIAAKLLAEGKVTHKLRWGYNWDGDGEIGTDQTFQDLPHFELIL